MPMSTRDGRGSALDDLRHLLVTLERSGTSVLALARQGRVQEPWTLYPSEYGIFDHKTRSQFYYHAHAGASHEAGHFHTVRFFPDHTVHLVGVSMTDAGWPQALFTVNLWAVGDAWEPVDAMKEHVRRFHVRPGRGDRRLIRFMNLVVEAFRPEIEWLQEEKERALTAYRLAHAGASPFEDRTLEVLSRVELDLEPPGAAPGRAGARAVNGAAG
jgi:hypothetical protein